MNRPLALIEGALALPSSRPLSGLPPPFGSWRRSASHMQQRTPQPGIPGAPRYAAHVNRRGRVPHNAKFLFFYKLPQRRADLNRFDEQLAEAKRYLEADNSRPASTRSDHILGAMIFVGCSIALAWLLATCSTHDIAGTSATAARPAAVAIVAAPVTVRPAARVQPETAETAPRTVNASATIAQAASPVMVPLPQLKHRAGPVTLPQRGESQRYASVPRHIAAENRLAKIHRLSTVAPAIDAGIEQRTALSRSIDSPAPPSLPRQPELAASQSSSNDSAERSALLDWAAQQRRANVTTRASVPVPGDTDWNAHMTQRRITDNPAAFQADRAPQ